MKSLQNDVVLITGAARGIGRALVRAFLEEGARVVATDVSWSFEQPSADDIAFKRQVQSNPAVLCETMDITIDAHVKRVYRLAIERFSTLDVIINNGGMRARDLYPDTGGAVALVETDIGDWQRMFDTHVFGTMRVIKTFSRPMLEKRSGSVINVGTAGVLSNVARGLGGPYLPAKAAMHYLTMYLADDFVPYNIAANVLCPGFTRTTGSDQQSSARGTQLPQYLKPESVTPTALFLARQRGDGVTKQVIDVMEWNRANGFGGFEQWRADGG